MGSIHDEQMVSIQIRDRESTFEIFSVEAEGKVILQTTDLGEAIDIGNERDASVFRLSYGVYSRSVVRIAGLGDG